MWGNVSGAFFLVEVKAPSPRVGDLSVVGREFRMHVAKQRVLSPAR